MPVAGAGGGVGVGAGGVVVGAGVAFPLSGKRTACVAASEAQTVHYRRDRDRGRRVLREHGQQHGLPGELRLYAAIDGPTRGGERPSMLAVQMSVALRGAVL